MRPPCPCAPRHRPTPAPRRARAPVAAPLRSRPGRPGVGAAPVGAGDHVRLSGRLFVATTLVLFLAATGCGGGRFRDSLARAPVRPVVAGAPVTTTAPPVAEQGGVAPPPASRGTGM